MPSAAQQVQREYSSEWEAGEMLTAVQTSGGNPRAGENCDEYPFASTSDADKGGQVSKCVISKHNSRKSSSSSEQCPR